MNNSWRILFLIVVCIFPLILTESTESSNITEMTDSDPSIDPIKVSDNDDDDNKNITRERRAGFKSTNKGGQKQSAVISQQQPAVIKQQPQQPAVGSQPQSYRYGEQPGISRQQKFYGNGGQQPIVTNRRQQSYVPGGGQQPVVYNRRQEPYVNGGQQPYVNGGQQPVVYNGQPQYYGNGGPQPLVYNGPQSIGYGGQQQTWQYEPPQPVQGYDPHDLSGPQGTRSQSHPISSKIEYVDSDEYRKAIQDNPQDMVLTVPQIDAPFNIKISVVPAK